MGFPMAGHLAREHEVIVWNRTREKAESLLAQAREEAERTRAAARAEAAAIVDQVAAGERQGRPVAQAVAAGATATIK